VFACVGHEAVVFGGQGGVGPAGLAGGHEQCLPQHCVAAFGRSAVSLVKAGGVEERHQAGEGSGTGEGGEPVRVAEPSQDGGSGNRGDTGSGGDDAGRVGFPQQQRGPFVEVLDLLGQLQRQPGLEGDVLGQVGVIQLTAGPQFEGLVGGGEQRVGVRFAQAPRECR
jgi:hypothetical protein